MIVLDTNVISEAMKAEPDPQVVTWLNRQAAGTLFLSSVTLAELLFGVVSLPDGRRKSALQQALADILALFEGRLLSFDREAAQAYATMAVRARDEGKAFPIPDAYIAAIASATSCAVATRDVSPFLGSHVPTVNPWEPEA
ncbi:MAG: type II toxin-antitoxin system VapC family toxin [Micrococcales bacterium]|nr:type II toxin-antitoxin system VapC family toxin [Micrococcales bacterium]MCL2668988.1 type II toxin-antitoxin system VapC family toxin [Micrococcales bacterium]